MNEKYQKYIDYIVNDIESPYFINMGDMYGLSEKEYELVLSKIYNQPVTIKNNSVYDTNSVYDDQDNKIYHEDITGFWKKWEYDADGNETYTENSYGNWYKKEYDANGNQIYYGDSDGYWSKWRYDNQGNRIYYEDSDGYINDNR